MLQRGRQVDLPREPLDPDRSRQLGREPLERDGAAMAQIARRMGGG